MWLGGLFTPEAYLTATRQCAAQALGVSLEELVMNVEMLDQASQVPSATANVFLITGSFDSSSGSQHLSLRSRSETARRDVSWQCVVLFSFDH
jgi:hypothetical protein